MASKKRMDEAGKKIEQAMVLLREAKKIVDEQTNAPGVVGWIQGDMQQVQKDLVVAIKNAGTAWGTLKDTRELF